MMTQKHLAQINISRLLAPLDSPQLADFVAQIDKINAIAEGSEGFVWRLKDENGNATELSPFEDDMIIVNMSVWESAETLKNYVFKSMHTEVMRNRNAWFEKIKMPMTVLWWVDIGHIPTVIEAKQRLENLQTNGESDEVFTFKRFTK
jgi:hypothetical protein